MDPKTLKSIARDAAEYDWGRHLGAATAYHQRYTFERRTKLFIGVLEAM